MTAAGRGDAEAGPALLALGRRLQGPMDLKTGEAALPSEVLALNDAVRALADERLGFWHDPAQFARLLRSEGDPQR